VEHLDGRQSAHLDGIDRHTAPAAPAMLADSPDGPVEVKDAVHCGFAEDPPDGPKDPIALVRPALTAIAPRHDTGPDLRKVQPRRREMTVRIGINGFGRIGRDVLRCVFDRKDTDIEVVAVNDITSAETLAHLLKYDSTYGTWQREVTAGENEISVDDKTFTVLKARDPREIPWAELGVDIVLESTGKFRTRETAAGHLTGGARKVVISAPGKDVDATIVLGVNTEHYDPEAHDIISNASCTTNCVAPMVEVLHRNFGVERGLMTIGDPASCVFDSSLTMADQRMAKVFGWYDNEWGYASRTVDLIDLIARNPASHYQAWALATELIEIRHSDFGNTHLPIPGRNRLPVCMSGTPCRCAPAYPGHAFETAR
jgi:Glyceraldehyde 3-phosphate dehydrogenase, NAD binding domain